MDLSWTPLLLRHTFVGMTHCYNPIHPKPLILSCVDALATDAGECFSLGTILEWLIQFYLITIEMVAFVIHSVMDGWPIMYNELFPHNF